MERASPALPHLSELGSEDPEPACKSSPTIPPFLAQRKHPSNGAVYSIFRHDSEPAVKECTQ